ncbi:nuclear transport factor 2 family protein [Streptomyces sp. B21-106]|uniref:nuclear transport factor 2 family protein n=1 Tax=Streptomyces sp. B21-106 TaxID=3039418 RepID=UPI002FF0F7DC
MTSEAIATVEAYFDAFGTRDMERVLSHFTPEATWTIPGDPALTPWAGSRTGPVEIRQSLTAFFAAVEPLAFEWAPWWRSTDGFWHRAGTPPGSTPRDRYSRAR